MQFKPLAGTHMSPSIISYGASPLGGAFGPIDESEGIHSVHAALDNGINFFDTSPLYGETRSETVLGKALKGVPRDSYYLCSKVGRYAESHHDFRPEVVRASVEASMKRLGVDHLDLILCHDLEYVPIQQALDWAMPVLDDFKLQGKVLAIGVSGYPLKIYETALNITSLDAVLVYCHYNLFDTTLLDLLPRLEKQGVGVISASPMGMGLLSNTPLPLWHPAPAELREACSEAFEYCRQNGEELPALALQFAVANERIGSTLVGMPTVEMVRKNVKWADTPLNDALLTKTLEILKPFCNRPWPSGLPENNGDIRI